MIYLVVQGLIEKADSIGYDLAFQYRLFRQWGITVRVFAGQYRKDLYPDIPIETIDRLAPAVLEHPAPIVYHWCDGWDEIDDWLVTLSSPVIIRWHNNTPPWFFAPYSVEPTARTVRGFRSILKMAEGPSIIFWVNSEFTARQLKILGISSERVHVVYPASHYIEHNNHSKMIFETNKLESLDPICLLFVGRVVPHKGHRHVILVAHVLQQWLGKKTEIYFPGRTDNSMSNYLQELKVLAKNLKVSVNFPGEVSLEELNHLYQTSHAFVGLSEHEGFGLPIIEAMLMGLPVVGYRTAAVAELLAGHPLACDHIDYYEIARKLAVAIQPEPVRSAIVKWQSKAILPRFTCQVIEDQLACALSKKLSIEGLSIKQCRDELIDNPESAASFLEIIYKALQHWENISMPVISMPSISKDFPNNYVTLYDVQAYDTLLHSQKSKDFEEKYLRDEAMRITFHSARPVIGTWINFIKKATLILQDGLVTTIAKAQSRLDRKLSQLDFKLERIIQELIKQPHPDQIGMKEREISALIQNMSDIYDETYFEGQKARSNYESYSKTALIPSEELARVIWELFKPKTFLDAGCALGFVVKAMRAYGVEAYGVDVSKWAVQKAGVPYIKQLDISLQPINEKYDVVIAFDVLEHIPESRLPYAVRNLWQATLRYLIVVPSYYEEDIRYDHTDPAKVTFHSKVWWENMLCSCGVTLDAVMAETLNQSSYAQTYGYAGRFIVGVRYSGQKGQNHIIENYNNNNLDPFEKFKQGVYKEMNIKEIAEDMNKRYQTGDAYPNPALWVHIHHQELERQIVELIDGNTTGKRILELGAGTGGIAAHYIHDAAEIIATDLSEVALKVARDFFRKKSGITFSVMDAQKIMFPDNSFDLVIAKEVIEHLHDVQRCVNEVYRVLKPGGLFVLSSPNRDSLHLRVNRKLYGTDFPCSGDHIHELTYGEIIDILHNSGFAIETSKGVFLMPYHYIKNVDNDNLHSLVDSDPEFVDWLCELGRRIGPEFAFCYVIKAKKSQ